jgi:protein-S-isoprenylcysteine O-methyltransferase Ste14
VNEFETLLQVVGTSIEPTPGGVGAEHVAFAVGVVFGLANLVGYLASALGVSTYWPVGDRDRWYYLHWSMSAGLNGCLLLVAILDWGTMPLARPHSTVAGATLFVPFWLAGIWAGNDLGSDETMGLTGELRTDGWYRYSRNPQYTCYLVATVGLVLLASSWLVTGLCVLFGSWWLVMPFAEEPWLRKQYGSDYEHYADRVPRFVGLQTARRLVGARTAGTGT